MSEKLLTAKEAAEVCSMSVASFYRLARHQLPAVQLGAGMVRFDPADLRAFVESRKRPAASVKESTDA